MGSSRVYELVKSVGVSVAVVQWLVREEMVQREHLGPGQRVEPDAVVSIILGWKRHASGD